MQLKLIDQVAMAMTIRDSTAAKNELILECWTVNGRVKNISLDRKKFNGNFFEAQMSRTGSKVEFKLSQIDRLNGENIVAKNYYTFSLAVPEMYELPITAHNAWFQRMGNTNHVLMSWTDFKFTWVNEQTFTNIPNFFNDGDLFEVDVKNRQAYLNGAIENRIHALGNQWDKFAIEPGKEFIQPVCSSWANMFEVEIEMREAYL